MLKGKGFATGIVAGTIIMIAALVYAFVINKWEVTLVLNGPAEMTLEYGESYEEADATATFHGTKIFKKGWPVEVSHVGLVNVNQIGTYYVTYSAGAYNRFDKGERIVHVVDTVAPEISLVTDPEHYTLPGHPYEEEGFSAADNYDGDISALVTVKEKKGKVYYRVADSSGNETKVVRKIKYDDPIPPEIFLEGDEEITIKAGAGYDEPGYRAEDNVDGDLTAAVAVKGKVEEYTAGTYELVYTVTDGYGNTAKAKRTVVVEPVRQPDVVKPKGKVVYLTFDDGPGPETGRLLKILDKYNVKATFFVVNGAYNDLIAKEYKKGHSVGIHTASHVYSEIYASEEAFFEDLYRMQGIIKDQTGHKTTLMRFPGGSSNAVSKSYCPGIMTKLVQSVTDSGFQYFDWNITSGDAGDTTDTEEIVANVIEGMLGYDTSIVLQHDSHGYSIDAVEKIIVWGLGHGYTFLPLKKTSPTAHHGLNN